MVTINPTITPRTTVDAGDSDSGLQSSTGYTPAAGYNSDKLVARVVGRMTGRPGSQAGTPQGASLLPIHNMQPASVERGLEKGEKGMGPGMLVIGGQQNSMCGSAQTWGGSGVLGLLLAPARCFARQESGATLMICVAAMWSITASLDKLGVLHAPSVWVYFAAQRFVIGMAAGSYLVLHMPHVFGLLRTRWVLLLLAISAAELAAVVLFLEAIKYIFVSYVVAIKRCNILVRM